MPGGCIPEDCGGASKAHIILEPTTIEDFSFSQFFIYLPIWIPQVVISAIVF